MDFTKIRSEFSHNDANQKGAVSVEYILMVALIAVSIISSLGRLGEEISSKYIFVGDQVAAAGGTGL